ncbi:energy transducer TonB [Roseobacteraceae bacterium NS-SX3]
MQTGTKISLAGHGLLVGWAVFGAWFPSEPLPMQVQEVALISAEDFDRLSQRTAAPVVTPEPAALPAPEEAPQQPEVAPAPEPEPETAQPAPVELPAPDPEVTELPEPEPEPEAPSAAPEAPEQPEVATVVPEVAPEAQQRPADRVAPVPVAPPPPDAAVDEIEQPEVAPEEGTETADEVQQATAPEAASDRIVTEENEADRNAVPLTAPLQSVRPRLRPARPAAPKPEPEQPVETAAAKPQEKTAEEVPEKKPEQDTSSAVDDALAEALAGGETLAPEPSGPPLTAGEKDALRVAVSQCWNVGSLSTDALKTTVVVKVALSQDGKPDTGSIRMLSSSGGSDAAARQAFEAARRAIIRCGAKGFQLPAEKYAQWRDIEMTFNPERMRIK